MRPGHILLILLILVALASHAYVTLQYDYKNAPRDIKLALGLGFAVAAILALLLGPKMLGKRGKGAPIILPILAMLVVMAGASVASADTYNIVVQPGETVELPVGGNGAFYRVEWCVESADTANATSAGIAVVWLGEEYANTSVGVWHPCTPKRVWWAPGGAKLKLYARPSHAPARFHVEIERREGTTVPVKLVLPPGFSSTLDIVPSTTGKGVRIEGRHQAAAYIASDKDATGASIVRLVGSESGDWANLKPSGAWLHAQGNRIQLYMKNYSGKMLYVKGYVLLEPLDNTTSNDTSTEQEVRNTGVSPAALGAGALGGLAIALLLARRG